MRNGKKQQWSCVLEAMSLDILKYPQFSQLSQYPTIQANTFYVEATSKITLKKSAKEQCLYWFRIFVAVFFSVSLQAKEDL